jgi:hypothetical protein
MGLGRDLEFASNADARKAKNMSDGHLQTPKNEQARMLGHCRVLFNLNVLLTFMNFIHVIFPP